MRLLSRGEADSFGLEFALASMTPLSPRFIVQNIHSIEVRVVPELAGRSQIVHSIAVTLLQGAKYSKHWGCGFWGGLKKPKAQRKERQGVRKGSRRRTGSGNGFGHEPTALELTAMSFKCKIPAGWPGFLSSASIIRGWA